MLPVQGRVVREVWVRQGQQLAETFKEATLGSACGVELNWVSEASLHSFTSVAVASPVENIGP